MSDVTFTPGPWKQSVQAPTMVYGREDGGRWVCSTIGHDAEAKANARIITALPGLLELAAEAMYERGRRSVGGRPRWDKLNPNEPYDMGMKEEARRQAIAASVPLAEPAKTIPA